MTVTVTERPPLELHAEVTMPDGSTVNWHPGAADPEDRPRGIGFSTARYDGFKTGACSLPRRIDRSYFDTQLFHLMRFISTSGDVAYEGQITALPRTTGAPPMWNIQAAGLMANARDRKFAMPFVDRNMGAWTQPSLQRRANNAAGGSDSARINASASTAGMVWDLPNESLPANTATELFYTAPFGTAISEIVYEGSRTSPPATIEAPTLYGGTSDTLSSVITHGLTLDGTLRTQVLSAAKQYLMLRAYMTSGATPAVGSQVNYSTMAVYGDHGIAPAYIASEPGGILASDVITWLIENYCPLLNANGVQTTSYPIAQLAFNDRTFPYDAFLTVNSYHRWGLECWEGGTVHYQSLDLTDYDWELRLDDFGTALDVSGAVAEEVANGIEVTYTNAATGGTETLLPDNYEELRDSNPLNPVNRAGRYRATDYTISSPVSTNDALQIGLTALAEFNAPKHKGTATREGYIRDRAGNWQPVWKVRGGDRVLITDSVDEDIHVVHETDYSHEPRPTIRMAIDDTFQRLDAYLDRYANALQAAGL